MTAQCQREEVSTASLAFHSAAGASWDKETLGVPAQSPLIVINKAY